MAGKRRRRGKQLLDDLTERTQYWKLEEEALDRAVWRTRFGSGCSLVARQTTKGMTNITRAVQITKGRGLQLSTSSCHFLPLRRKYLLQRPILKHPQPLFSLH